MTFSEPNEQAPITPAQGRVTALMQRGSSFEGSLTFEGVVRLGGNFKGDIFTRDTLVIEAGATVEARVEADVVIVSGEFNGTIVARRRVVMHPPAKFRGIVTTPSLQIHDGVLFEGASHVPTSSAHHP